ncbi:MAG TPA: hypothetical protein VF624_01625 [Tepidisphaeraceae bacterium]
MLKRALLAAAVAAAFTFSGNLAFAEEAPKSEAGQKKEKSPEDKKKHIEKYDKDGDGVLNEQEKAAAKADREKAKAEKKNKKGDAE